jgi:ABC-type multidrug transport system permease subunit
VILGNPTSGGSVPVQMMSGGWRFLARVLPTHAGVSFIRSFAYLDGNQMAGPLTVLLIYTAVSVLVLLNLAVRRDAGRRAGSAVTVAPAGTLA